jgi:hypothetical protein
MAEAENEFAKELAEAFAAETADDGKKPEPPKADPATPPAADASKVEEPKKDEPAKPEDSKEEEPATPPTDPTKKAEEDPANPKAPEAPQTPEEPKPLTKEDVTGIIQNIQTQERTSTRELENTTKDVLDAYYPEGLSNVLIDQTTGRELRTPADVVAVTNGSMTTEEAAQWLMNEQWKLDQSVGEIRKDAERIAETTINFKRDSIAALQKYEPLFKAYPQLQSKVFDKLMQGVKADEKKGVILSAPDVMDHYDFYLEPYQKAFEFSKGQSATNPVPAPGAAETPPAPKPSAEDRMDEGGDGSPSKVDDPNDFAQQVKKELAGGMF